MRGPRITVTCDCGAQERLGYGEQYRCGCGRSWSTAEIPAEEYGRVESVVRRYRIGGWALAVCLAALMLFVALTRPFMLVAIVPAVMIVWLSYLRPVVRRRYRRALADVTKSWQLQGSGPPR